MATFDIRRLGLADLDAMKALNRLFGDAFEDPASYHGAPPDDAYLLRLLGRDHIYPLAAFDGAAMVGGLVAYELEKFEQARSEVYIYDLAVLESQRRRGVATALITETRRIAAARGAWVVFVQADHGDEPAVALYTKLGTREDVMHFESPCLDLGA